MALSDSPTWIALTRGTIEAKSRSYAPRSTTPVWPQHAAQLLAAEVQRSIAAGGRVEHATDVTAVLTYGTRLNHVLHLLLAVITFGLWLIVWAVLAVISGQSRVMLTVDQCGNISRTTLR